MRFYLHSCIAVIAVFGKEPSQLGNRQRHRFDQRRIVRGRGWRRSRGFGPTVFASNAYPKEEVLQHEWAAYRQ